MIGAMTLDVSTSGLFLSQPERFMDELEEVVKAALDAVATVAAGDIAENVRDSPVGFRDTVFLGTMINSIGFEKAVGSWESGGFIAQALSRRGRFGDVYHTLFMEFGTKPHRFMPPPLNKAQPFQTVKTPASYTVKAYRVRAHTVRAHSRKTKGGKSTLVPAYQVKSYQVRSHTRKAPKGEQKIWVSVLDPWIRRRMSIEGDDIDAAKARQAIAWSMGRRMMREGIKPRRMFGRARIENEDRYLELLKSAYLRGAAELNRSSG